MRQYTRCRRTLYRFVDGIYLIVCYFVIDVLLLPRDSIERLTTYKEIEQEPTSADAGTPPAYSPASRYPTVEKLRAKYSTDGDSVLHNISTELKPVSNGERFLEIHSRH